jgi:hypothetical protein
VILFFLFTVPTELTAKVTQAMDENEGSLIAARADR